MTEIIEHGDNGDLSDDNSPTPYWDGIFNEFNSLGCDELEEISDNLNAGDSHKFQYQFLSEDASYTQLPCAKTQVITTLPVLGYDTTEQYALKKYIFEQAEVLQKCREELGHFDSATMMTLARYLLFVCLTTS